MKQNITVEQFNELNPEAKEKLFKFYFEKTYSDTTFAKFEDSIGFKTQYDISNKFLTIGNLILFLKEQCHGQMFEINLHQDKWHVGCGIYTANLNPELCDALWDIVKLVLEENFGEKQ